MQKSGIEWCDYTSNPVKGDCPVGCSYCYVKSFRARYGWHKDIRFYPSELDAIRKRRKSSGIFLGSTIELFHDKTIQYMPEIMGTIKACPQHRFYLLTKCPENLAKFSPFPDNVWLGVTATDSWMFGNAVFWLRQIEAKVKFLSIEPLREKILPSYIGGVEGINQVIIGAQTKPYKPPKIEWVEEIVRACDKAGVVVFLKNNLRDLLVPDALMDDIFWASEKAKLRQELPDGK